jgi:four helix bundle protein
MVIAESENIMSKILSFRDLKVWQSGMALALDVYRVTAGFPTEERYGLTSQSRRSAVSIPANVAEGHARRNDAVFLNHLRIALGSQAELWTEVELASRLGYISGQTCARLQVQIDETRRMLHGLRRSIEQRRQSLVPLTVVGLLLASVLLN